MRGKIPAWLLVAGLLLALPAVLSAGECTQTEGFYVAQHYIVKNIKLEAPLDIFHLANRVVNLDRLDLKAQKVVNGEITEKGEFNSVDFATSGRAIRDAISAQMGSNFRVQFVFVLPKLANCNDGAHTLDAIFKIYHVNIPASLAEPMDLQHGPVIQGSSNGSQGGLFRALAPQITAGYDTNLHLHAGGRVKYQGSIGDLFDAMTLEGSGSSTSTVFQVSFHGGRSWKHGPVQQASWAASYRLSDLPSTSFQLQESKASGRFSGSSPTLFRQTLVLYFGTAIDAGNQHSTGAAAVPANVVLQSQAGNLKGYLGAAWRQGPNILHASYGIQAGKSTPGIHVDYLKHLLYATDSLRLLPQNHRPLTLDLQSGAGWITGKGPIPLAETFFGGNLRRDFIPGDTWPIAASPFIRSFPTNSLSLAGPAAVGGTNFFSANATLAYVLWGKPLVPASVLPKLEPEIKGQLKTSESLLQDSYVADLADFKSLVKDLSSHSAAFADLRGKLKALKAQPGISSDIADQVDSTLDDLGEVDNSMTNLETGGGGTDPLFPVLGLLVGSPAVPQLTTLADDLKDLGTLLKAAGMTAQQADFQTRETDVRDLQAKFLTRFKTINQHGAEAKAKENMRFPESVLNQLLHALNIYSIAPAVALDAARLGSGPGIAPSGMRYGAGPAVRLSLLNVDLTLGYSVNPSPRRGEHRGAPLITCEISDIFR